jgi:hypothetical protein
LNELEVEEVDKAKELEEMKEEWDMFVEGNASRDLRKAGLEKGYVASLLVEINLEEWYLEREFLVRIWQDVRDWDNWAVRREACFKEVLGCIDALSYLSTGGLIGPGKEEELEAPLHTSSEVAQAMSRHVMELMRIVCEEIGEDFGGRDEEGVDRSYDRQCWELGSVGFRRAYSAVSLVCALPHPCEEAACQPYCIVSTSNPYHIAANPYRQRAYHSHYSSARLKFTPLTSIPYATHPHPYPTPPKIQLSSQHSQHPSLVPASYSHPLAYTPLRHVLPSPSARSLYPTVYM